MKNCRVINACLLLASFFIILFSTLLSKNRDSFAQISDRGFAKLIDEKRKNDEKAKRDNLIKQEDTDQKIQDGAITKVVSKAAQDIIDKQVAEQANIKVASQATAKKIEEQVSKEVDRQNKLIKQAQ